MKPEYICEKCGSCCRNFALNVYDNSDTQDFKRSVLNSAKQVLGIDIEPTEITIHIKGKCKYLDTNTNLCKIYDKRPQYCRNFWCGKKAR